MGRPDWTTHKLNSLAEALFAVPGHWRSHKWPTSKIVHDCVWGTQTFEGWEVAIIDIPAVQRLRNIHQTSLAYLTFPTALHTRFDHSRGVCTGTKRLAQKVLTVGPGDRQFDELSAAALLHDIGHGPFSHLSEEAYPPDQFLGLTHTESDKDTREFPKGSYHEVIGALLLRTDAAKEFFRKLINEYNKRLRPEKIGDIITGNVPRSDFVYANLVNGPFDADKIDYLQRDSFFTGVPIAVDVDRLIHSMSIGRMTSKSTGRSEQTLGIKIQGVTSAEQILFGKATLTATVYHHHKVRAADCLFKAIADRMFATQTDPYGREFKDPVDMLRLVDSDFTRWIAQNHSSSPNLDETLHHFTESSFSSRAANSGLRDI